MNAIESTKRKLAAVLQQQQETTAELTRILTKGERRPGEQEQVQARLSRQMAEYQRLSEELKIAELERRDIPSTPRARSIGRTLREQTLDILDEVAVPMAPSAIAEFAAATTDVKLQPSRFASLRRDEERASRRDPLARPAWIVPALSTASLTPIPRLLASSAWEAERRLVGARTPRVNHLRTVLAYLRRFELLRSADPSRTAMLESIVRRHARGIPGATVVGEAPDPDRIRAAVETELSIIEAADAEERKRAVPSFERLAPIYKLWGRPAVIDGAAQSRRGA